MDKRFDPRNQNYWKGGRLESYRINDEYEDVF